MAWETSVQSLLKSTSGQLIPERVNQLLANESGPGNNGNEGVLHNPQDSRTRASPSDVVFIIFNMFNQNTVNV